MDNKNSHRADEPSDIVLNPVSSRAQHRGETTERAENPIHGNPKDGKYTRKLGGPSSLTGRD